MDGAIHKNFFSNIGLLLGNCCITGQRLWNEPCPQFCLSIGFRNMAVFLDLPVYSLAGMLSAAEFFLSIQRRRCGLKNKTANGSQRTNDKTSIATTT
jgi:hypothetical protein